MLFETAQSVLSASSTQVKGSDCKRHLQTLVKRFPALESLSGSPLLLPKKDGVVITKLQDKISVVLVNNEPLYFQVNKDYFPTVYAMWQCPSLILRVTIHAPVMKFVKRGADIMFPGIVLPFDGLAGLGHFQKDDPVAVSVGGSKRGTVAVGKWIMSRMEIVQNGRKGKAIKVLHVFEDHLWEMGSKAEPKFKDVKLDGDVDDWEERVEDNESDEDGNDIVVESPAEESREPEPEADEEPSKPSTPMMMDEPAGLTVAKTDELFMDALARACVRTVENKTEMGFSLAGFFSEEVLEPYPVPLNIKNSSYKKLSNLIKAAKGLITAKNINGDQKVMKINTNHQAYKNAIVTPPPDISMLNINLDDLTAKHKANMAKQKAKKAAANANKSANKIEIQAVYRMVSDVAPLIPLDMRSKDNLFSDSDLKSFLKTYSVENNLSDGSNYRMDDVLKLACIKSSSTRSNTMFMPKKEAYEGLQQRMTKMFQISFPDKDPVIVKKLPMIDISEGSKAGNKKTTILSGVTNYHLDPQALARAFSKQFAASATVQNNPTGVDVFIQGSVTKEIRSYLRNDIGIPDKYIVVHEPKPKKKKN
eukprot:TRINITY_DN41222_c0_g1_i1.p1 TRINITY_DN41222_c0_g1~~TRINITY_DN41222_c0_g1_i1.p1  ORF type:complete len:590 (-),score=156.41 TRINITY_DN41222_c0_g1_i1:24-1793(-)